MPVSYLDLYKKGIQYFDRDIPELLPQIQQKKNIVLCSAPATGDERFLDYLSFQLENKYSISALAIKETEPNLVQIQQKVQSADHTVLIFPYFKDEVEKYTSLVLKLIGMYDRGEVSVILRCRYTYIHNTEEYMSVAKKMHTTFIRKPLNESHTVEAIQVRCLLSNTEVPKELHTSIYELSGGLLKLIKRLCTYTVEKGNLSNTKDLAKSPTIYPILQELSQVYSSCEKDELEKFGLTSATGHIRSRLLQEFVQRSEIPQKIELPPKLRSLFNLLYENRNHLVTNAQFEKVIRDHQVSSDWANYKLVARLRSLTKHKYKIRTVRGKGYVLSEL
ncbi:MAG: helix-turn-helix domain-containing protein [Candidatus Doudnabacteria bacterium]|nr:helix-turn-helix domain-containing protein [Candidatus Doudnabacteria bacterium]